MIFLELKEKIIREALRQFSSKGYVATSTSSIINAVGTSKGGLYNHFKNKEQLFLDSLSHARKLWRERNLDGLEDIKDPKGKIEKILMNYKDNYLTDSENLPGGCIFVNLAVELSDDHPELCDEINEGFDRLKGMIKRLLSEGKKRDEKEIEKAVEVIFSGLIGACVIYSANGSKKDLDKSIEALVSYLRDL